MRLEHLSALAPLCPVALERGIESPLEVVATYRTKQDHLIEGLLRGTHPELPREYPVIDGLPLLVRDLKSYLASGYHPVSQREDLSSEIEGLLADCHGPGSPFDAVRQHRSTYGWDHWGDFDPAEQSPSEGALARPGSIVRLLSAGLELAGPLPEGPILDLGCAAGRASFELAAASSAPILGYDLSYAMLGIAAGVLIHGVARYPRRRVGLVHDRRRFAAEPPGRERVDFWAGDALALPFGAGTFGTVVALNLLDCVPSPRDLLAEIARVLAPGGKVLLASPYDWSSGATALEAWLGGHSARGEETGASEVVLRDLLTPGAHPASIDAFEIIAEQDDLPWRVRSHDRSATEYRVHLLALERT